MLKLKNEQKISILLTLVCLSVYINCYIITLLFTDLIPTKTLGFKYVYIRLILFVLLEQQVLRLI